MFFCWNISLGSDLKLLNNAVKSKLFYCLLYMCVCVAHKNDEGGCEAKLAWWVFRGWCRLWLIINVDFQVWIWLCPGLSLRAWTSHSALRAHKSAAMSLSLEPSQSVQGPADQLLPESLPEQWTRTSSEMQSRAPLVAQWLRVCLPMQGTRLRALVWEDPTCRGATGPVSHNDWACASGACAPQQERPRQWEARASRWRVAPACRN